MGGQASQPALAKLLDKYSFISDIKDNHLQNGKLFRKKTQSFDYIVVFSKLVHRNYAKLIQKQLLTLTASKNVLPFMRIYTISVGDHDKSYLLNQRIQKQSKDKQISSICNNLSSDEYDSLTVSMEYMNYTLDEHIAFKKRSNQEINLKQYVYIMKTFAKIGHILESSMFQYLEFDLLPQFFYIGSKGQVKIYPLRSKLLRTQQINCQCMNQTFIPTLNFKQKHNNQCHTQSPVKLKSLNDKQYRINKYLKQIKNMSFMLMSTINQKISQTVRKIQDLNIFICKQKQLMQIKNIQSSIVRATSIVQIINLLAPFQDDLLTIGQLQDSNIDIKDYRHFNKYNTSHTSQSNKQNITVNFNQRQRPRARSKTNSIYQSRVARRLFREPSFNVLPEIKEQSEYESNNANSVKKITLNDEVLEAKNQSNSNNINYNGLFRQKFTKTYNVLQ